MNIKLSPLCFALLAVAVLTTSCTDYRRKPYAYSRKRYHRMAANEPAGALPDTPLVVPAGDASAVVPPSSPSIPPSAAPPISIPSIPPAAAPAVPAAPEPMVPAAVPGLPAPAGETPMVPGATPMVPGATPPPP